MISALVPAHSTGGSSPGGPGSGEDNPLGPNHEWFRQGTFERTGKFDQFLLSPTHPVGRHKFRWLRGTYGFGEGDGELFERLIREQLDETSVIMERSSAPDRDDPGIVYRQWEVLIPEFEGKSGNAAPSRTAWALDPRRDRPHFTNAYPAK